MEWLKAKFLTEEEDREAPAHRAIKHYASQREILAVIEVKTGKTLDNIGLEKGPLRQMVMDLLHRHAGMTNPAIGKLFRLDYSSVSQERKRLRLRLEKDKKLGRLNREFELELSRLKK